MLDEYDPDRKLIEQEEIFVSLKNQLPAIIMAAKEKQKSERLIPLSSQIAKKKQKEIAKYLMQTMQFDFAKGRLDESAHPYCMGTSFDTRITTCYYENDLFMSMLNIVHEVGHGLYEQNLPENYKNQPIGRAKGMGMHESQSLLMEMQIGRSKEFSIFFAKILKDQFSFTGKEYEAENIYKTLNRVKSGFIRVDADELTYPMHIIIRYEIEKALINEDLSIEELPQIWKEKMKDYLGIEVLTDREGCLQDIHWPSGCFGYFPAYTNGAIIASMLMQSIENKILNIRTDLKEGDFSRVNQFLGENVWNHGSIYSVQELVKKATSYNKLSTETYINYLKSKYLNI